MAFLARVATPLFLLSVLVPGRAPAERKTGPSTHALVGVTVVTEPGRVLTDATILIQDGRIEAVGPADRVKLPAGTRRHEGENLWVYAGFIESWYDYTLPAVPLPERDGPPSDPGRPGPGSAHVRLHPESRVVDALVLSDKERVALNRAGFTVAALMPDAGVLRGRAALVQLGAVRPEDAVLRAELGVVAGLLPDPTLGPDRYPGSVMGAVAAVRQALLDAQFYRKQPAEDRPYDPVSAALVPVLERKRPLLFATGALTLAGRAAEISAEAQVRWAWLGSGGEWRHPELVPHQPGLILPVDFTKKPKIEDQGDWVDVSLDELRAWDLDPSNPALLTSLGHEYALTTHGLDQPADLLKRLRTARDHGLSEDVAIAALTTVPARLWGLEGMGKVSKGQRAYLTVLSGGSLFDPDAEVSMVFVDGEFVPVPVAAHKKPDAKAASPPKIWTRTARFPGDDRGPLASPAAVVVRNATLWTSGPQGVLEDSDLLVSGGKIRAIGRALAAPGDALVIDGTGLYLSAGLVDTHTHIAMIGGWNEWTVSSSAMVRVRDCLNSEDRRIYEALAGGVTTAHVLHGSANPIGGQCQAIKLRWGAAPEDLVYSGANPTIKFALGENPKRGNDYEPGYQHRYPQSRMGVDDFIRGRFAAAEDYRLALGRGEVGRDLELETLLQILDNQRDIHCHSYRQDEILSLMRLMEEFDSHVAVFTHVLEGYKVADELAAHGAAGSTFADWWAYKFEVYDAIPQNTSIMDERGVSVSVNSDSPDLGRRLNTEAAKSVRYGGTDEETALRFVTLNPADQLGAADHIGSLEVGKDADFVVWNAPPLSTRASARQTWIEGVLYWDADLDLERQRAINEERAALIALAVADTDEGKEAEASDAGSRAYEPPPEIFWANQVAGCNDLVVTEVH